MGKHSNTGEVVSITNHKGGVGKTTTAINIGAGLNMAGKNILLVDLDPQANLSQSLGIMEPPEANIYRAIRGEIPMEPVGILPGLDLIPSTLDLSGAEIELSGEIGREYILRELLDPLRGKYDYILIDCPPSLGLLTVNALTASQEVIIPIQAHYLALHGLGKLTEVVEKIRRKLNPELKIGGILLTQYDSRKILNRDVETTIRGQFPEEVFNTKIRDNIALAEAPTQGMDVFRYSPKSYGAQDYGALCGEILTRNGHQRSKPGNIGKHSNNQK